MTPMWLPHEMDVPDFLREPDLFVNRNAPSSTAISNLNIPRICRARKRIRTEPLGVTWFTLVARWFGKRKHKLRTFGTVNQNRAVELAGEPAYEPESQ
jgi:hypothetical protein